LSLEHILNKIYFQIASFLYYRIISGKIMAFEKVSMGKVRARYKKLPIDRKWIILALVVYILTLFLKINIWPLIFLAIFCVLNAILLSIDRYVQAPLDLELSTLTAVLLTMKYGLVWGIVGAVMTKLAGIVYNKNIRVDHFFMILGYVIAALCTNLFKGWGMSIIAIGIISTIIVNIYTVFNSKYITMLSSYEIFTYGISNTIFNIVIFIGFADLISMLMPV
jgi:hypothetical protein